jgi:talin
MNKVDLNDSIEEEEKAVKKQNQNSNESNNGGRAVTDEQKRLLFVEYQTKIIQITKTMQQIIQEMILINLPDLSHQAQTLTQTYNCLILACKGAIQNSTNTELTNRIKQIAQDLGKSCIDLINLTGQFKQQALCSLSEHLQGEFQSQIELVNQNAIVLLKLFQNNSISNSSRGIQACIQAENSINGILADLNTVIMFATAGTLKSDMEDCNDSFSNHRESVLRSAKMLVEDTKTLVSVVSAASAASISQDDEFNDEESDSALSHSVQTSVRTIGKLAEHVKMGAGSLGSEQPEAQILVINSVKDVASSLKELVATIKIVASNNTSNTNSQSQIEYSASLLSESAKNMITNVQSLLKTIKTVEDEAQRGTRALESTIEAIFQEIKLYSNSNNSSNTSSSDLLPCDGTNIQITYEDLFKATRQITLATPQAIRAGTSLKQEDIIEAANRSRKAISDLLYVCHYANKLNESNNKVNSDENQETENNKILNAGLNCAFVYKELLEMILNVG